MVDILVASFASAAVTRDEIEAARSCIDNASFRMLETLLELNSPDIQFRHAILEAVALYKRSPDPASRARKNLKDLRGYLSDVLQHLHALEGLLPASGEQNSNFLYAIFGQGVATRRRFEGQDYLAFRMALSHFVKVAEAAKRGLKKDRVPPNLHLEAEESLVRQLAEIFQDKTGRNARNGIRSNYTKSKFHGAFFQMANEILGCVGHRQQNVTMGRMIVRVLGKPARTPRPI
jgi:hypothetical protein